MSALPHCLRRGQLRYPPTTYRLTTGFSRFKYGSTSPICSTCTSHTLFIWRCPLIECRLRNLRFGIHCAIEVALQHIQHCLPAVASRQTINPVIMVAVWYYTTSRYLFKWLHMIKCSHSLIGYHNLWLHTIRRASVALCRTASRRMLPYHVG